MRHNPEYESIVGFVEDVQAYSNKIEINFSFLGVFSLL